MHLLLLLLGGCFGLLSDEPDDGDTDDVTNDDTNGDTDEPSDAFDEPLIDMVFNDRLCIDLPGESAEAATSCAAGTLLHAAADTLVYTGLRTPNFAPALCLTAGDHYRSLDDLPDTFDCSGTWSGTVHADRDLAGHGVYYDGAGRYKILIHNNTCDDDCDLDSRLALSWAAF